ncbi:hypothetical protein GP486_002478 [Trichoglossum hirsutum]|uniref:Uncharacterized protein n=1 Tax=Trichoglossum hirsutum TaxID=265104 RepID=A0A9P8LEV5_9PEZI|nr:hypothetical protein GP486_002478 [Trichoglossum hirsutum]
MKGLSTGIVEVDIEAATDNGPRTQKLSLQFKRGKKSAMWGHMNELVLALPDTGADKNILSAAFAREYGIQIIKALPSKLSESLDKIKIAYQEKATPSCQDIATKEIFQDAPIGEILKLWARTKPIRNFPTERRILPGTIDGVDVLALPDTGADKNILSAAFARRHGIQIEKRPEFRKSLQLGDRITTQTTGQVMLPWSFANEPERVYHVPFEVLEKCPADVIIGNEFLGVTKTMSANAHRLVRKKLNKLDPFSFHHAGLTKQFIAGTLGGMEVYAFPDTGCDLNLMSDKYARMRGFTVDTSPESRVFLKFPDGRVRETRGVVRVPWSFAEDPSNTEDLYFDILPGSTHDVILGGDFLFKSETIPKHTHRILTEHSVPRVLELNQIIWFKHSLFRWSKKNKPVDVELNKLLRQRALEAKETERVLMARNEQQTPTGGHFSPSMSGSNQTSTSPAASAAAVSPSLQRPCGAATGVSSPHPSSAAAVTQ